jgi:transposase
MSTSPYSQDLREKVINYLIQGNRQTSASKTFSLHISTVTRWYTRYRKEGNCRARKRPGAKSKIDSLELSSYVTSNPSARLEDLSKKFGISIWGISYWLKKLGFNYKKKVFYTQKQAQQSKKST